LSGRKEMSIEKNLNDITLIYAIKY